MSRGRLPQDLILTLDRLDRKGYALGEVQREVNGEPQAKPVQVRNGLPDERIQARILKRRRGVWLGQVEVVETPSAQRTAPLCDAYPRCGGCSYRHLRYPSQLFEKNKYLLEELDRCKVSVQRLERPVFGPQTGYRRSARLGVRRVGERLFCGFREAFSSRVVEATRCYTLDPRFAELVPALRDCLAQLSVAGVIPQVEMVAGDQVVCLTVRHLEPMSAADREQLADFAARHRLLLFAQPGGYDSLELLSQPAQLSYANPDFGLLFRFEPGDFIQVNADINRSLVRRAVSALADSTLVADLFCGIGNFSLPLARAGKRVLGVELGQTAVARARANAAANRVQAEFSAMDLYKDGAALNRWLTERAPDALLLDPPRSGAGPHLASWLGPGLRQIAYVSCNPTTFAEDARVLQDAGFSLANAGIYDMFPHTAHVETFGHFVRESQLGAVRG